MLELKNTVSAMTSTDYKERFKAEYFQLKIRFEKLKSFNTKIEAARRTNDIFSSPKRLETPKHDCPEDLLMQQQRTMEEYLHVLKLRAEIEGIDLTDLYGETENR